MMLVADAVVGMTYEIHGEFAVDRAQRDEFRSSVSLGSSAFIGINVRRLGTDHRFIRTCKSLQTQDVGCGSVENEKHGDALAKMLFKFHDGGSREGIVTVADNVSGVGTRDGSEDFGMDDRVVIACKAAAGFHAEIL